MSEIKKQLMEQIESGKLMIRQTGTGDFLLENIEAGELPPVVNTYKDRIFRMIFKNKKELLVLYNAMNNTHYANPDDLIVTTLENAIYLSMKNDISFVLYDRLMLYEHQSTKNPNMPLRNLFYVSDIYSSLTKDKNLFGTKLIRIPEPKFVVFYNGIDKIPERSTLKLSDMFESSSGETSLELVTQVFNINLGYNKNLMEKCRTLHDYTVFVDLVRRYRKQMSLKLAISQSIDECISSGVLTDFLKTNKAEVLKMSIYEYDEEKHIRMEREDAREEGIEIGEIRGTIRTHLKLNSTPEAAKEDIMEQYALSDSTAQSYIEQYWKTS